MNQGGGQYPAPPQQQSYNPTTGYFLPTQPVNAAPQAAGSSQQPLQQRTDDSLAGMGGLSNSSLLTQPVNPAPQATIRRERGQPQQVEQPYHRVLGNLRGQHEDRMARVAQEEEQRGLTQQAPRTQTFPGYGAPDTRGAPVSQDWGGAAPMQQGQQDSRSTRGFNPAYAPSMEGPRRQQARPPPLVIPSDPNSDLDLYDVSPQRVRPIGEFTPAPDDHIGIAMGWPAPREMTDTQGSNRPRESASPGSPADPRQGPGSPMSVQTSPAPPRAPRQGSGSPMSISTSPAPRGSQPASPACASFPAQGSTPPASRSGQSKPSGSGQTKSPAADPKKELAEQKKAQKKLDKEAADKQKADAKKARDALAKQAKEAEAARKAAEKLNKKKDDRGGNGGPSGKGKGRAK